MAIRKIIEIGDNALRQKCKPVVKFNKHLHTLLDDMAETMAHAEGVGLAAPQVGVLRRLCVVDVLDGYGIREYINPIITQQNGEVQGQEGCLSVPGRMGMVTRPQNIVVNAQDRHGNDIQVEANDFLARAICHEMDHLDGKLYVDIMDREIFKEELEEMAKQKNQKRVYRRANAKNEGDN